MTDITRTPTTDAIAALPAATQQALERVKSSKSAWLAARQKQADAAGMADNIRKRREETEAEARAQNKEWRQLFRENQGAMTPRMKKLRAEIALGRETLSEFDDLLAAHQAETETLPWTTGDRAVAYTRAHQSLINIHSSHVWAQFMKEHGQALMHALSLRWLAMRNEHAGGFEGVNDSTTMFKRLIDEVITSKVMNHTPSAEGDALLEATGLYPASQSYSDVRLAPSPMTRHKIMFERQKAAGNKA
ncbi:MAG: septation initiation protein [Mixta calida]|nr:septation initiation protein [Mixta calida]